MLFDKFQTEISKATYVTHFRLIKRMCLLTANDSFKPCIEQVQSMESLLDLLAVNRLHCNWIKIGFLEDIAQVSRSKELTNLLKDYKAVIFSKKLSEIWASRPHQHVCNKYYKKLTTIFNDKNPENTTVEEVRDCCGHVDLDDFIIEFCHKCLSLTWLIPTDKVYQQFLSVLTVPQESRQENFLEIGTWIVHHPQSVLQKLKAEFG